jgi:hypothetical protein
MWTCSALQKHKLRGGGNVGAEKEEERIEGSKKGEIQG